MNRMRVYISGKKGERIISKATREKFAKAEELLKAKGYEVVNPAREDYQEKMWEWLDRLSTSTLSVGLPYDETTEILWHDLQEEKLCAAIYMLPDWIDSKGARVEHSFAVATDMIIWYEDEQQKSYMQ